MSGENNKPNVLIVVAIIGALGAVVAAIIGNCSQLGLCSPTPQPDSTQTLLPNSLAGKYLMDGESNRIIRVKFLGDNEYRIEEPSSPWPWEGTAVLDGGKLSGNASFRNSLATMRVEGIVRGDGSIAIKYKFIKNGAGNSAGGRVDNHVWYPSQ